MKDQEIIDEVLDRLWHSNYYDGLDETEDYFVRVLVRYTRWLTLAQIPARQREAVEYVFERIRQTDYPKTSWIFQEYLDIREREILDEIGGEK